MATALCEKAATEASRAKNESNKFVNNILNPVITAANGSRTNLDAVRAKVGGFINALPPQQHGALERKQQKENEGKSTSKKLEASTELNKKLNAPSIQGVQENAKEFFAKQAKDKEIMGCISKIIGWIITVVSVAPAANSTDASLALAIDDTIGQAITGHSFMQEVIGRY